MTQRLSSLGILIAVVLLTAGLASGEMIQPDRPALFRVAVPGEAELALVEASGATVYARLSGQEGPYLLVGAPADQPWPAELDVTPLDKDVDGATYVIAYALPGQARPDWRALGELLLEDDGHALLRTSAEAAGRLGETGLQLRVLTMDPKPLRPAPAELTFPPLTETDPLIQEMIDQVDSATVYSYTAGLSGEWPVEIGGSPYTITTRYTYSGEPIHQATQYVGEHLADLGLAVEYHQWGGASYPNVIGELTGLVEPEEVYIIGAHLDDMPSGPIAPGADDNASGSVAVLMAADILTQHDWGCTLRFALWTGEEQWLLGSKAYAQRAYDRGEQIAGYLNLDMIGYNSAGSSPGIDLYADPTIPGSVTLTQLFSDTVGAYDLDLIPELIPNGMGSSDHASFWDYGFTAILAIEDWSDHTPHYHKITDEVDTLDLAYFTDFVKASVGTFAHMNRCLIRDGIGYLDGHVTDADEGSPLVGAAVTASGSGGHILSTETDSSGYYTRPLYTGTYTVTVQATHYLSQTVRDVAILANQVTTWDVSLEPWLRVYLPLLMASG